MPSLREQRHEVAEQLHRWILDDVMRFASSRGFQDDATLLAVAVT